MGSRARVAVLRTTPAWLARFGPTKVLQPLLMRTPLVALPIPWGRLFSRYRSEGHLAPGAAS